MIRGLQRQAITISRPHLAEASIRVAAEIASNDEVLPELLRGCFDVFVQVLALQLVIGAAVVHGEIQEGLQRRWPTRRPQSLWQLSRRLPLEHRTDPDYVNPRSHLRQPMVDIGRVDAK